jgi:hypothetical protein
LGATFTTALGAAFGAGFTVAFATGFAGVTGFFAAEPEAADPLVEQASSAQSSAQRIRRRVAGPGSVGRGFVKLRRPGGWSKRRKCSRGAEAVQRQHHLTGIAPGKVRPLSEIL